MSEPEYHDIPEDSPAGMDIKLWGEYIGWCESNGVTPRLSDYLVWLDDWKEIYDNEKDD